MPVASETSRIQYTGNGSSVTPYGVPFYFLANADIRVVLADAGGMETLLAETTHYTLTGAGNPAGGNLTTVVAYNNTYTLTIYREPEQTQSADFQSTGALPADTLTRGLDKLTMIVQSVSRKVARCFRFNDKAGDVEALSEAARANTVFGFGSSGEPALRDRAALLSLLSLSGSLQDAPTAFWADDGERALKVPEFTGQIGLQLDASAIYRSTGTSAGNWTQIALTGLSGSISDLAGTLSLAKFADNIITYAKLQNVSATQRLLGRNTAGAGASEEVTLSQLLDWIGSAAQGDILFRGAAGWERLATGTAGQALRAGGAGADPSWGNSKVVNVWRASTTAKFTTTSNIPPDNTIPQITEGVEVITITLTPSSTSNFLVFTFSAYGSCASVQNLGVALFRDAIASAVYARRVTTPVVEGGLALDFTKDIQVPSTASQVWRVRVGPEAGAATYINAGNAGVDQYGGVGTIQLVVMEVQP